jgi:hypothetical protein
LGLDGWGVGLWFVDFVFVWREMFVLLFLVVVFLMLGGRVMEVKVRFVAWLWLALFGGGLLRLLGIERGF